MKLEKLQKLREADLHDLADRGIQEARKWLERAHLAPWGSAANDPPAAEIERALQGVKAAPGGIFGKRFFRGALQDTAQLVASANPESVRETLSAASSLRAGRFDLLGYKQLSFGWPIDWHFDPVNDRHSPRDHWSTIATLDREQVGDSKVIWELSRSQWWVTLARAAHLSGDDAMAAEIGGHLRSWLKANPPARGINWASSLEAAMRIVSWSWTLYLTRESPGFGDPERLLLIRGIAEHARHVSRYLSHHYSPNTHLTGEALGLFYAGCVLPELHEARAWRETGAKILVDQLETQVHPDGVYFELATCYQRYTVEIYLHLLILAAASGFHLPEQVSTCVTRLLDFLIAVRRPDGSMPPIGDADGGWLLPLAERGPSDLRGIFSTAAAWFGRADYAWAAGSLAPETLWLLGDEGRDAFLALDPKPPAHTASRLFPDGGFAVMSSGWERDAHQLLFDCGPLGCRVSGGHGHADLLSIQCNVFGEPAIVDPGTFVYAEPSWRAHFRGTRAHSTVTLDGQEQAQSRGLFGWHGDRPRAQLRAWNPGPELTVADAWHEAWMRAPSPLRHRRRVIFVEQKFWVICDELDGDGTHGLVLRFQLAPLAITREPAPGGGEWVRAKTPNGHALLLRTFAPEKSPLALTVHEGEMEPPAGWVSPDYGQLAPAPLLAFRGQVKLPTRVTTLLWPLEDANAPAPLVTAIQAVGPHLRGASALNFSDGRLVQLA